MRARTAVVAMFAGCGGLYHVGDDVAPPDAALAYPSTVLADHPVGYFRLGERAGVTVADLAGGPPGTLLGDTEVAVPGAIAGDPDTAFAFDGREGGVSAGSAFAFPGAAPFSLECWVRPEPPTPADVTQFHTMISRWRTPATNDGYELFYKYETVESSAYVTFSRETPDAADLIQFTDLPSGIYTHVVATYDGASLTLYRDGRQVSAGSAVIELGDVPLTFLIGAGQDSQTSVANGRLDEVAIYDAALSPERVYAHYLAGTR